MLLLYIFNDFIKTLSTAGHIVNEKSYFSANSQKYKIQHSGFGALS